MPSTLQPPGTDLADKSLLPGRSGGGRTWWAHVEFTRMNIEPTILCKKTEEILENSRSGPSLLTIARLGAHQTVARNH
jgi:hypothetical protein